MIGKEFMDENFLVNPQVNRVAKERSMSEFHFYRCFKQVYGISPYQYMLMKRLQHANVLLNEEGKTISSIASECGFPDLSTFSKAFKRKFGFSPSKKSR